MTRQKSTRQRLIDALARRGKRVVRTGVTVKIERTPAQDGRPATYYYVGTRALRFGTTTATSRPCSEQFRAALLSGDA